MSDIEQALVPVFSFLESFRSEVREGFQGLDSRLHSVEIRLDSVETRLGSVESRLDSVESRLGSLEIRFGELEKRFDRLEARVEQLERRVDEIDRRLSLQFEQLRSDFRLLAENMAGLLAEDFRPRLEAVEEEMEKFDLRVSYLESSRN